MTYLYLILAIVFEVIGTTFLKDTNGFTVLFPTVVSLVSYAFAFYMLSLCVQNIPTGVIYAIWSGAGIVLVSAAAYFIYKQSLDLPAIVGITFIILGVVVIQLFSKTVH